MIVTVMKHDLQPYTVIASNPTRVVKSLQHELDLSCSAP